MRNNKTPLLHVPSPNIWNSPKFLLGIDASSHRPRPLQDIEETEPIATDLTSWKSEIIVDAIPNRATDRKIDSTKESPASHHWPGEKMLHTRSTEMLGISHPVMSAPMTMHCGGKLAAAVSQAGGLGSFGGINPEGPDWVLQQIRHIRSQTDQPFGVGFITQMIADLPDNFQAVLDERVPVIAFSFVDPKPWLAQAKDSSALVMCQVQSLQGAEEAVSAGADVLVAQGNEAGGHIGGMNSLPLLVHLLNRYPQLPVLASGGISDGRGLAAVLAAGAEGAWVGTAFLTTPEVVEVPDTFNEQILLSDGQDTAFTQLYDQLGDAPWPQGIGGRVYCNRFVREWDGREEDIIKNRDELVADVAQAWERQDPEGASVYMGQSAGGVNSIRPAARVLQDICDQAESILRECFRDLLR